MARPKLRLDLSTAENKENQSIIKDLTSKDLKRKSSTDVVAVRELQAFQTQVPVCYIDAATVVLLGSQPCMCQSCRLERPSQGRLWLPH